VQHSDNGARSNSENTGLWISWNTFSRLDEGAKDMEIDIHIGLRANRSAIRRIPE